MQDQSPTDRMQLDSVSSIAVNTLGAGAFGGYGFTLLLDYLGIVCSPWLPFFVATCLVSVVTLAIYRENPITHVTYQSQAKVRLNLAAVLLNILCLINIVNAAILLALTLSPLTMPAIITITIITWLTMASCYLGFHRQTLYALWQQEQNKTNLYHLACLALFCIIYAMVPITPIMLAALTASWLGLGLTLYFLTHRAALKSATIKQFLTNALWHAINYSYQLLVTRTFWLGHVAAITKGTVYGITSYLTLVAISTTWLAGMPAIVGLIAVSIGLIAYLHQRTKLIAEANKVIFPWNKRINKKEQPHPYPENKLNWLRKLLNMTLIAGHFVGQFAQIFVFALDPTSLALTLSLKVVVVAIAALITAYTTTRYYGATLIEDPKPYQYLSGEPPQPVTTSPWTTPAKNSRLMRGLAFSLGFFIFGPTIFPGIVFMCYQHWRHTSETGTTYISVWSIQGGMGIFYGIFGSLVKGALPLGATTTVLATLMSPHIAFAIGIVIGLCIAATQGLRAINSLVEKFCEIPATNLAPATCTQTSTAHTDSYLQALNQLHIPSTSPSTSAAPTNLQGDLPTAWRATHAPNSTNARYPWQMFTPATNHTTVSPVSPTMALTYN